MKESIQCSLPSHCTNVGHQLQTEIMSTKNGLHGQSFVAVNEKKNFFCKWQIFGHADSSIYTTPAELQT